MATSLSENGRRNYHMVTTVKFVRQQKSFINTKIATTMKRPPFIVSFVKCNSLKFYSKKENLIISKNVIFWNLWPTE